MSDSPEQTPPVSPEPGPMPGAPTKDDCTMAMLAHLLGIFLGFIGPLIIWLIKKDQSAFVDDQGKEALNFQLTILIASVVAGLSFLICIGVVLLPAVLIFDLVFCIIAALKANGGELYRYPLTIRMIK